MQERQYTRPDRAARYPQAGCRCGWLLFHADDSAEVLQEALWHMRDCDGGHVDFTPTMLARDVALALGYRPRLAEGGVV